MKVSREPLAVKCGRAAAEQAAQALELMFEMPVHERCPFCDYVAEVEPCAFVTRGPQVSAFLNRSQFERGALLLVPNHHVESILDLDAGLIATIYTEAQRIAKGLVLALGASGLNVFQNNGLRAGQSVSHYHVHLVPRYETSQPWRRFRESEFEQTPFEELERLALDLRAALELEP
jgi:histidine triad (HIT) family protein